MRLCFLSVACIWQMANLISGFPVEPIKYQRSAPSVRLLNEIDILLTQVRLAELYLKQAQAAAADEAARIHERYESELANLRAAIGQKERSLDESSARTAATEQLHLQPQDLQARLEEHRRLLGQKDEDLRRATVELETSRSQVAQLQLAKDEALTAARDAERVRQDLQTELGKLRDEIAQKSVELRQHRSAARESEQLLQDRVRRLQDELAQQQVLVSEKDRDLERARAEFQARLQESEALLEETERQSEERRAGFAKVERDLRERLNESDEQLRRKQACLDESESELQKSRAEIAALRAQLADGQSSLERRTGELQQARSEIAALRERAEQLDLLQKQTERLLAVQAEQIRQRVRAELEDLDARLASKDRELQAVRDSAAETLASLNATISGLRLELEEKLRLAEGRDQQISDLKASASGLTERVAQLASAARDAESWGAAEVERVGLEHQAELLDIREELCGKQHALAEQEARAAELERRFGERISDLETQVDARQRSLEEREEALNTANSSAVALQERLTRLEASAREEQLSAAKEFEQARRVLEAALAGLRNELKQKDRDLAQRQALVDHLGQKHESRVQTLEAALAETRQIAEKRTRELDEATSERQRLLCRVGQLESAAADGEATAASRVEQITRRYETQVAALQFEIEQKRTALEEQDAARNNLVRTYRAELSRLRAESQEKPMPLDSHNKEFLEERNAMGSLRERLTQVETTAAKTKPGQTTYYRSDRRWRSSGGWKRRWKT